MQFIENNGKNTIRIEFASPVKTSGAAVTRYIDKQDGGEFVYSLFVPSDASMAFPVFDQPDLKARFSLSVTKPDAWKAEIIGNTFALDLSSTKIGWTTHRFEETKPISTYVFAFAAGDFVKVSDASNPKSGNIFVRRSQAEKFKQHVRGGVPS